MVALTVFQFFIISIQCEINCTMVDIVCMCVSLLWFVQSPSYSSIPVINVKWIYSHRNCSDQFSSIYIACSLFPLSPSCSYSLNVCTLPARRHRDEEVETLIRREGWHTFRGKSLNSNLLSSFLYCALQMNAQNRTSRGTVQSHAHTEDLQVEPFYIVTHSD